MNVIKRIYSLEFKGIITCILPILMICFLANGLEAQSVTQYQGPDLSKLNNFSKKANSAIAAPFIKIENYIQKRQAGRQAAKNKAKEIKKAIEDKNTITKDFSIDSYHPIKIQFPKWKLPNLNKILFKNKSNKNEEVKISNLKLRQIKKSEIEKLRDHVEDINSLVYQIELKKADYINKKNEIESAIEKLNQYDSLKKILKDEIEDVQLVPTASVAIPVGFIDIDEQIRNLQLLEKIPSDNSLTIRPYYSNTKLNYSKMLNLIDTNIRYDGLLYKDRNTNISLLPINFLQKLNTNHPYGWNDGAMSYSKGYQFQVSGGVFLSWKNIKIQLRPEFINTANDKYETSTSWGQVTPGLKKVLPGQSSIRYDFGGLSLGMSTQNLWWGPGNYNSMLMSNNAPGFFHYSFGTNRPLKSFLGNFQFQLVAATLSQDTSQGYENKNLKTSPTLNRSRYYNALVISYQPVFMKNVSFGITRAFQNYADNNVNGAVPKYLPVVGSFFGSAYNDTINRDQILSFNTRWVFPKNHAEVYFEFGYNDAKDNFRDLMVDMSHSSGYIYGFKKLSNLNKLDYLDFGAEVTRMAQTPSYLMRNAGNFYEHGRITQGYTNNNQTMGAGSGFGNNMQTVNLSWNRAWNKFGLIFNHIVQNPMALVSGVEDVGLRTIKWEDFSYGIQSRYRYRNILFSANLELVNSKNYLWMDKNKATNIYAFINTIFLW